MHDLCVPQRLQVRLAAILTESNATDALQAFKKMKRSKVTGKASLHEAQQLDRQSFVAFGQGLSRFEPSYFKDGVRAMTSGCFSSGSGHL